MTVSINKKKRTLLKVFFGSTSEYNERVLITNYSTFDMEYDTLVVFSTNES